MHDAIQFELHGKPTVCIIEDTFESLADGKRRMMGLPAYEPIYIPHPQVNKEEAVRHGRAILDEAVRWLTRPPGK